MISKKVIIAYAAIFIFIEAAAIFYAFYTTRDTSSRSFKQVEVVRIGVVPQISKKYTEKYWEHFISSFSESSGYILKPYYANSFNEIRLGFLNDTLDIIFINPGTYLSLKEKKKLYPLAYQKLTERAQTDQRSSLITNLPLQFLNQTKGLRITFAHNESLLGYTIPYNYLKSQLPVPLSEWFKEVYFAPTKSQALIDLIDGDTDLAAIDKYSFDQTIEYLKLKEIAFTQLWLSRQVPESLLCYTEKFKKKHPKLVMSIKEHIKGMDLTNKQPEEGSISFRLVDTDFSYNEKLDKLIAFLKNMKSGDKQSNILMTIGGEK